MKKIILLILIALMVPGVAFGASYYGCATAEINADNTFCDTPTGSCAGDNPQTAATVLAGTHNLFANGCTISIPNTADLTITAAKLSNKDDGGAMVDGGKFTYVTSASYVLTLLANVEAGGTTAGCLEITGSGAGAARVTIGSSGSPATITGGSASNINGVTDNHTAGGGVVYANITSGSFLTGRGYYWNGSTGTLEITGNCTGSGGAGCTIAGNGTATLTGNCIGSSTAYALGCTAEGAGALTVVGNLINGSRGAAAHGTIVWNPAIPANGVTGHYMKFDGGGTAVFVGKNTDDATKASSTFYYIDPTDGTSDQGSASAGGSGGAWGF